MAIPPENIQKMFEHPGSPTIPDELVMQVLYQIGVRSVEQPISGLQKIDALTNDGLIGQVWTSTS